MSDPRTLHPYNMPLELGLDYSTINVAKLHALPVYKQPYFAYIDRSMGSACAGDAPGHPSYFLQAVYIGGNSPANGPDYVLFCPQCEKYHRVPDFSPLSWQEERRAFLKSLYIPVPMESLRFKLWEQSCYIHFQSCYYNPQAKDGSHVSCGCDFKALIEEYEEEGNSLTKREQLLAIEQHYACHAIREVYPTYKINLEWAAYRSSKTPDPHGLEKGFFYHGEETEHEVRWIEREMNNRWWERFATYCHVGIGGLPIWWDR